MSVVDHAEVFGFFVTGFCSPSFVVLNSARVVVTAQQHSSLHCQKYLVNIRPNLLVSEEHRFNIVEAPLCETRTDKHVLDCFADEGLTLMMLFC